MKKNKIIILYDSPAYFISFFNEKGFLAYSPYRELPLTLKVVRNIFFRFKLPKHIWFDNWKKKLIEIDTVIIFSTCPEECVKFINSVNPKIKIIFWYWNPVIRSISPHEIPDELCEKWSFDRDDCKKFKLKYNTSFYLDNIKIQMSEISYDLIFVGLDKGRKVYLEDLKGKLNSLQIKSFFYITDDNATHRKYNGNYPNIEYKNYLNLISKSKSILDIVQTGQNGLSLRPMESIFFQKKLITNDLSIRYQDFYVKENIFILGQDSLENINQFLITPYKNIPKDIVQKYDVESWVQRFLSN
jgi:hypothetical protein